MTGNGRLTRWRIACALIVALSGLIYAGSLGGIPLWDDVILVNGRGIGGGDSLLHCFTRPFLDHYHRPLVSVLFFFENRAWHGNPLGYHVVSVLMHAAATGLLLILLRLAFRRRRIAALGALLFAVQPAQTGAIAWIGGQTDALCEIWMLLWAISLVRGVRATGPARFRLLAAAVICWTAALFTKEQMLATLPLAPLALLCFGRERSRMQRSAAWRLAVPYGLAAALFVAAGWSLGLPRPSTAALDLAAWAGTVGRTATYYALLLLTPTPRLLHTMTLGTLERAGILPVITGYALIALAMIAARRWFRTAPAATWFAGLILLPFGLVSNIVPLPFLPVAPYRAAVSGIGVAAIAAWLLLRVWGRHRRSAPRAMPARLAPVAAAFIVIWGAFLSVSDATVYRDGDRFFGAIVRHDPDCLIARYLLASRMIGQGREREAIPQLESLLTRLYQSQDWRDGAAAAHRIRTDEALRARIRLSQGSQANPALWATMILSQLGFSRLHTGDLPGARSAFNTGAEILPNDRFIQTGLGICAYESHDLAGAEQALRHALRVDPHKADAHECLGYVYVAQNRWREAQSEFAAWTDGQPDLVGSWCALADADLKLGDRAQAGAALRRALAIAPARGDIRSRLEEITRGNPAGTHA